MDLFGPALGALKARNLLIFWLRGVDLNHRPLGYEPKPHTYLLLILLYLVRKFLPKTASKRSVLAPVGATVDQ